MYNPIAWLFSFADFDRPLFETCDLRIMLGVVAEQLIAANIVVHETNAASINCPRCDDGHVEEIFTLDLAPGNRRHFIPCPQYERVEILPELRIRWGINWLRLVQIATSALELNGACTTLVEGRLWRLGRTHWQGQLRDVLFARGLNQSDGAAIVSQITRGKRSIVLVGDRVPPTTIWPGRIPPVIPLSTVTSWIDGAVVIDRESVISTVMDRTSESAVTNPSLLDPERLELIVRRQIRAENKTYLSDDVLVAAYQQTGSIRKAATILSQQAQVTISKDRVARAVERAGGALSIRRAPRRGLSPQRH